MDGRFDQPEPTTTFYNSIWAQRFLPHAPVAAVPELTIGAIGTQAVAERQVLRFTVTAPTLNPATAVYSASNLPPGAVFEAATRTFRWMAGSDQAGTYPALHFEATDGAQTVSEQATTAVTEASRSISGTGLDK